MTEWRESGDPINDDYPIFLTTGRVVSQYLSGTQTRRIGGLVDMYPEPLVEIHPRLAEQHGIKDRTGSRSPRGAMIYLSRHGGARPSGPTRCSFRITGRTRAPIC